MQWWTESSGLQLQLLLIAFVLSALIGVERQFRQKAAGFRTHVLVGTGAATFTLVSAYGFVPLLGGDITPDPSRIAAQIVSGIGFLGAGVIFTRRDIVRGLTTAATIWVVAAVGMAAGAGLISLAVSLTFLHLFALIIVGPIVTRMPTRDSNRVLRIVYREGAGTLRKLLAEATDVGFSAFILGTNRIDEKDLVELDVRFKGKPPLDILVPKIYEIPGVKKVEVRRDDDAADEDENWHA
ncbi:MAG TPA: MgtC/SapB family protein [Microbacteriaceae bacterium]|nr:MgtC/SapB family protein [Microbacteriaceae bacterium]